MLGQRKSIRACRAVSLAEVVIAFALFSLLSLILATALHQSSKVWRRSSGQKDASLRLRKVASRLESEIAMASLGEMTIAPVPASLPAGGYDGDALWFLSHINPVDGKAYLKSDGTPFWQCNVLYYAAVPKNVGQLSTYTIRAGSDPDSYEDRCPHKVLIRKVIDLGTDTDPTDEDTAEMLLTDPSEYLTRPEVFDTRPMNGESDLLSAEIVATELLLFRAQVLNAQKGVQFDLRATSIDESERASTSTSQSLLDSIYTSQSSLFVAVRN